jgi:DNA-binding transcriptional MerR regulator
VAKSKRQQQIARMKRMGFNNNQIGVILENSSKKAEELQRIATEKAFLYMLAIPLNVNVDMWQEQQKSLKRLSELLMDINENEIDAQTDMNNLKHWLHTVRNEAERELSKLTFSLNDMATTHCEEVVKLYEAVQEGVVSDNELADFLYEYAEVKIEADWLKGESEDE